MIKSPKLWWHLSSWWVCGNFRPYLHYFVLCLPRLGRKYWKEFWYHRVMTKDDFGLILINVPNALDIRRDTAVQAVRQKLCTQWKYSLFNTIRSNQLQPETAWPAVIHAVPTTKLASLSALNHITLSCTAVVTQKCVCLLLSKLPI